MGRPSFLALSSGRPCPLNWNCRCWCTWRLQSCLGGGMGPLLWGSSVRSQVRTSAVAPAGQAGWHRPTSVRWGRSWLFRGEGRWTGHYLPKHLCNRVRSEPGEPSSNAQPWLRHGGRGSRCKDGNSGLTVSVLAGMERCPGCRSQGIPKNHTTQQISSK